MECLRKKEFQSDESIRTGVIMWEDIMSEMYEELLGTAVDEILRNTEGLKALRKLKKNNIGFWGHQIGIRNFVIN